MTGSKGADKGRQRSRRHNQAAAATLSRREEAHSGPLLWYCSWPRPTTHPPSLSKQFVSLIALHTLPSKLSHQYVVQYAGSRPVRFKYLSAVSVRRKIELSSHSDFLYSSLAAPAVKCCSSFLSALESGLASVGALPSCLISWQIKGADPGLYK